MSGSESGRKKEMRGPWTAERKREGEGKMEGLSRRGEIGFLGRTLLLQIGPREKGRA